MKKVTLPAAIAITLFSIGVSAQQDFSQVEITAEAVAGKVTMLQGAGGNIGVSVGDDGILIIDDQFAPLADKIKAALADLSNGDLRYVLNTHFHGDHTGSNAVFGLEALIVAHENVRTRLSTEQTVRGNKVPPQPPSAWPVITFDDTMSIHFNGEEISLHSLPAGHTDGDIGIYFHESNVAHLGDHFFKGRFPFVDVGSGGTVQGMAANVATALENLPDDVKIIPGHGPLANKADLKLYHEMLEDCLETVQGGIDGGKSLDEIKAAGLSERWADWGAGFINKDFWIETIHTSLTQ
jgi:glyoxylase-like metal-dependent hydrolase (beta-lactamase superfamily II)